MPKVGRVYECPNCLFERPVRAYKPNNDSVTPSQVAEIEALKERFWRRVIGLPEFHDKYEWKEFKHELLEWGVVSLVMEIGRKNDEGTMAAILCRSRVHIFIGRKGGLYAYGKGGKKLTGDDVLWAHLH